MTDLFNGSWAPITNSIGFIKRDCSHAADAFFVWQEGIQAKRGVSLVKRAIHGNLEAAIQMLLPLTSVERRRFIFMPTQSQWTAFLDNGHQGTDVFSPLSHLARNLSCEAVRATRTPEGLQKQHPATILEIYGPKPTHFLNYIRSISVAYDGRKWEFATGGEPQSFEDVERYSNKVTRDKFTPGMLEAYLRALGIDAFEEKFYLPNDPTAILIEKSGPIAPAAREYALADLQLT